jgi:plasmid maintenance system antidote protein VapI
MDENETLTREQAAEVLGVQPDRVDAMIEEGMLGAELTRAEVEAVRLQGG